MALVLGATGLVLGTTGCQGEAQLQVGTPPPPPPPALPTDTDGDGIADPDDKCVDKAEDGLPPDPKDGCPSDDPDNDGIRGDADRCPNEPETINQFEDQDGCPDTKPMVEVTGLEIKINDKIMFAKGSEKIEEQSNTLLQNIADVMKKHADIDFIEIAGHASAEGDDFYNRSLTDRRAKAVMKRLVELGIDAGRMRAVGYGFYCPLDQADSEEAREKNRRVEFKILRRGGNDTSVKYGGCEAADKKGLTAKPIQAGSKGGATPGAAKTDAGAPKANAGAPKANAGAPKADPAASKADPAAAPKPPAVTPKADPAAAPKSAAPPKASAAGPTPKPAPSDATK
jgi:outer membrane protein OmpA-like peptidoglycan-associated protein